MSLPYPLIAVEEHWLSQNVRDLYTAKGIADPNDEDGIVGMFVPTLVEIGENRVRSLDAGSIAIQVISHVANNLAVDAVTCTKVNDELAGLIQRRPSRFAAFAILPMADPESASRELHRCVTELGSVGAMIDSNCEGRFYDDRFFWSVFAAAEQLDVPIYLHPAPNKETKPLLYDGNYPAQVAETLSQYAWGWHSETAIHFLRLFAAGLFDHHPRLKLLLGHLGEMLPYQLERIERITSVWPHLGHKLERPLRTAWDENVWVTISGMFYTTSMAVVLKQCKPERIVYSVDYPFGKNEAGPGFLMALKAEKLATDEVLEAIAYKNAERLLKIKAR